eukprot:CAMPEP_0170069412 /NCGR_PEP_ID=MMETSP0019_2-20121128/8097_1 /TAXON_ID=98059 /ORGANISM="Dinobryon sp., Strain UTEXLB2267" /LENGTH=229 /DNA_ID=CAMNT_0010277451 /DNA_START=1520 /DNA_END=2209 /DNA_ORIENTATION=-
MCLREGVGVEQNSELAFAEIIILAETNNYNLAHYTAALMLLQGEGVATDEKRAFKHFHEAAKGGVQPALYNMGNCFAFGRGVEKDEEKAFRCYEAAAEAGDPSAKFTLGTWYFSGKGNIPRDTLKAFQLQSEAANEGHPAAMFNMGAMYMSGSVESIEKDLNKARQWFEKAAEANIIEAAINLGNMYREGYGVEKDLMKAFNIFHQYSNRNDICKELAAIVKKEIDSNL